jgi:adenine-specific DNA-methyltransferase
MPQAGEVPAYKRYLDETPGVPLQDLWTDINPVNSQAVEAEGYATQKPEALLERIIRTSSDEDDVVLDCFLGSGTTAAVAHKLGRRWLGVEWSQENIESYAKSRLRKVVERQGTTGATRQGDRGFRFLAVAPSMFDAVDGQVFLSDWATNATLAEVTAAQLHYDFVLDPPFCGRSGRSRLAVIDGLVNAAVVQLLVDALAEGERLMVCGTAIDPEARAVLKERLPGSSMRKIPQSILRDYRQVARASRATLGAGPTALSVMESPVGKPA